MNGAFRLQPAAGRLDRAVHRPRLVKLLQARFDRRLTMVVAPAGSGKSTALALAIESNRIEPVGSDHWLGAQATDNDCSQLLDGLCQAIGVMDVPGTESTMGVLLEEVWSKAPRDIAIIVDDVHLITSAESLGLLKDLISDLPTNGHLVLLGRTTPALATARLQAHGELLSLTAEDLALDDSEVDDLLRSRAEGSIDPEDLPRHAALADLRLVVGSGAEVDFLEEEVLSALEPERRRGLARVSVLAEFDDAMALELSEGSFTAEALVRDLPLVEDTGNGSFRLHSLLRSAIQEGVSHEERVEVARIAARVERERDNLSSSLELLLQAGDNEQAVDLARYLLAMPALRRNYSELLLVRNTLLSHHSGSAAAKLVEVEYESAQIEQQAKPGEATEQLHRIAKQARVEGDDIVEAVAFFQILKLHDSELQDVPPSVTSRLGELGERQSIARDLMRHAGSSLAIRKGDLEEAKWWLDRWEPLDPSLELIYRATRLCDLGRPEEVGAALTPTDLGDLPDGAEVLIAFAMWLRGEVSPEIGLAIVADIVSETLPRRVVENSVSLLGVGIFIALAAGDHDSASRYLRRGETLCLPNGSARARQFVAIGKAAETAVYESDDAAGIELMENFERVPLGNWPARYHLMCLAFIYVVNPESRDVLDRCEFGRSLVVSVRAGRALLALREAGLATEAAALPWTEPDLLRVQVLPHHLCELALAASLVGESDAALLLDQMPNLPHLLSRVVAESSDTGASASVRDEAGRRLKRFPPLPTSEIRVVVLGEIQIWRDGSLVDDEDWVRRRRVRELLAYLVANGPVQRSSIAAALWPELPEAKAASNLRVNLSYLQRVLEPARPPGSAPFHVQIDGDRVLLHPETKIDVKEFERTMTEALGHDRGGAPGPALDLYRACLELYGGSFLAGFDEEWCEDNQVRLDSLALGAFCRVGELSAAKGEPEQGLCWATDALQVSELSERAGRLFANCLLATQDRPAAHQSLLTLIRRLDEAGLKPEPETVHLLERLRG